MVEDLRVFDHAGFFSLAFPDLASRSAEWTLKTTIQKTSMERYIAQSSADPSSECRSPDPGMSHETAVARRQVKITNRLGLHLRAADLFVRVARRFQCEIRVHYQGKESNGKSILDLTMLAAIRGSRLDLEACGPDAVEAVEALAVVVAARFGNENGDSTQAPSGGEPAA